MVSQYPAVRMRRMRVTENQRRLIRENSINNDFLVQPLFICEGEKIVEPIISMPDVNRLSIDQAVRECLSLVALDIPAVALFAVTASHLKTPCGKYSWQKDGLLQKAIKAIKTACPKLCVISDVALDPYTTHGQDGVIDENGYVLNDETISALVLQALSHADAGADIVAPSDMMDGRIKIIRDALEKNNFPNTKILAYSAKYASAFYGPFRDAVGSSSNLGKNSKTTYQMDPANALEALRETQLDIDEAADIVMVKPGLPYLDIIQRIRAKHNIPIFAYQVSGEYSMLKIAAKKNIIDEKKAVLETMLGFKRAGCNAVLTYYAHSIAKWLQE